MARLATGISSNGLLHGKGCSVSGVGPGLGRQAARALATHGADLVLSARRQSSLNEVASEVREMGARALTVPTDITDPEQCAHVIIRATEEFGGVDVLVKHGGGTWTRYTYANHPFDVVGWDGWLYPFVFNIGDFEPRVGRYHLPPPTHQTFEAPGLVICSFCPRPYDFGEGAIAVPYNHANVDSDEVLFYVSGSFMSRRGSGIETGSVSLHPAGFIHGPQPGAVEAAFGQPGTDETAVMLDTFRRLEVGSAARACEDEDYFLSWAKGGEICALAASSWRASSARSSSRWGRR